MRVESVEWVGERTSDILENDGGNSLGNKDPKIKAHVFDLVITIFSDSSFALIGGGGDGGGGHDIQLSRPKRNAVASVRM